MDQRVRWIRRRIMRALLIRSMIAFVVSFVAFQVMAMAGFDIAAVIALPWAILVGQLLVVLFALMGSRRKPLTYRFLRNYIDRPYRFATIDPGDQPNPDIELLSGWGLELVATICDTNSETMSLLDLYQSSSGAVTVSIGRSNSGAIFLSRMSDGRILETTNLLVPPLQPLIINRVRSDDIVELAQAHRKVLQRLAPFKLMATTDSARIFIEAMAYEHRAYSEIGPVLGSFCEVDSTRGVGLTVRFTPRELLELSLRPTQKVGTKGQSNGSAKGSAKSSTPTSSLPSPVVQSA